jgi:hypothetical protein
VLRDGEVLADLQLLEQLLRALVLGGGGGGHGVREKKKKRARKRKVEEKGFDCKGLKRGVPLS